MFIVREKGRINYELRMTDYELESVNDPRRTLGLNDFEALRFAFLFWIRRFGGNDKCGGDWFGD